MRRIALGLLGLSFVVSACSGSGASPSQQPSGSSSAPSAPASSSGDGIEHPEGDAAVLVVSSAGGLVPVEFTATAMPSFVMVGDGRVIIQGAVPAIFPGPALPALMERTLTPEGIQTVLEAVEETGLFTTDLEMRGAAGMIADAADTVFTLSAAGRDVTVTVYALGMVSPDMELPPGMTSAEVEAHRVLSAFNEALLTIDTAVPAEQWETEGWQPYAAEALRLYVRDVTGEPVDPEVPQEPMDWPTDDDPATFGEEVAFFGNGTRCGTVEGEDATAWLAALGDATQITPWTTDGENRYSVMVRPLLPYEEVACPDAGG